MVMWLKRLIRPLIPDRIMARYRLHQHSRQVRSNVDVLVDDERQVRRWLRVTPDTYRVGLLRDHQAGGSPDKVAVMMGEPADCAVAASAFENTDAVVVAAVAAPRLVGRRRVEPATRASAVVASQEVVDEIGGIRGEDLVGLQRRISDAGFRTRLLPRVLAAVDPHRQDRIERPVVVILAAVPMGDVGGGSRGAQLAIEFVRRGFHVVYVAIFGTHESVDLGIRFVHPDLEQYRFDEFDPRRLMARASAPGLAIIEIPVPDLESRIGPLREGGWRAVYDIVDLWSDPALGGDWYRREVEARFASTADLVAASAPDLVEHAARFGADALLIPNAVNAAVFARDAGPLPEDLPPGPGPMLGYHGSLYGDWFDWGALADVARRRPDSRIVLIGDVPTTIPALPGNVHLLGLKPQGRLPDYLIHFDVGLLPFVVSATTHAVSPLKVYEYLACGVPVAAPPLRSLTGIVGVATAERLVDAVDRALALGRPDRREALRLHSWEERVGRILARLGVIGPPEGKAPAVVIRPAIHYGRGERRL